MELKVKELIYLVLFKAEKLKNFSILLKEHLDKQVKKEKSFQEMKDKAKSNFKQRVIRNILESFHSFCDINHKSFKKGKAKGRYAKADPFGQTNRVEQC